MKLSVSLAEDDVATLRAFLQAHPDVKGMSGAVQEAVRALREQLVMDDYDAAMDEWDDSEDGALWDATAGDGLTRGAQPGVAAP
ncbi:antitoxin [Actinotalea sp. BY-33]|uniref:Antitoxin n=1 Tax=Actinotalea soli TaxID=2819234 RepID=A0A939LNH7_9CELL|nr:antitoxin [Actinotalea soli]MBO1751236.1 antitoxin [Actinotalea soli]